MVVFRWLSGEDGTAHRCTEEGADASTVAALPAVREALLLRQQELARPPGLIADGRDRYGRFPGAAKIFLTASAGRAPSAVSISCRVWGEC